jgi:hypothetical protein
LETYSLFDIARTGQMGPIHVGQTFEDFRSSAGALIDFEKIYTEEFDHGGEITAVDCRCYPFEFWFAWDWSHPDPKSNGIRLQFCNLGMPGKDGFELYESAQLNEANQDFFDTVNFRIDFCGLYLNQVYEDAEKILKGLKVETIRDDTQDPDFKELVICVEDHLVLWFGNYGGISNLILNHPRIVLENSVETRGL